MARIGWFKVMFYNRSSVLSGFRVSLCMWGEDGIGSLIFKLKTLLRMSKNPSSNMKLNLSINY